MKTKIIIGELRHEYQTTVLSSNASVAHLLLIYNIHNIHWHNFLQLPGAPALARRFKQHIPTDMWCRYPELIDYDGVISDCINKNEHAMDFLSKNQQYIDPRVFNINPAIFELDFQHASIERMAIIGDELMARALSPERVARWRAAGVDLSTI